MILIIDLTSTILSRYEFVEPIKNIADEDHQVVVRHYDEVSDADVLVADKIIVCGTALQDNNFHHHADKLQKLGVWDKPSLGICGGMQMLALAYSGSLSSSREIGMGKITCVRKNKLFDTDLEVYMLHQNSVEKLDQFDVLAENDNGAQVIKHKEKEAYGVLFHPEVRQEELIRRFLA